MESRLNHTSTRLGDQPGKYLAQGTRLLLIRPIYLFIFIYSMADKSCFLALLLLLISACWTCSVSPTDLNPSSGLSRISLYAPLLCATTIWRQFLPCRRPWKAICTSEYTCTSRFAWLCLSRVNYLLLLTIAIHPEDPNNASRPALIMPMQHSLDMELITAAARYADENRSRVS